jgi:putative flippase GtrA
MTYAFGRVPQLARFLLIGGVNTAFSYGVYAVLLFCGLNYAIANLMALVAGIGFSFKTQGRFVFQNTNNRLIVRFVAGWTLVYLVNVLLLREMIAAGTNRYVAGGLAVPAIVVFSYLIQRFMVFGAPTARPSTGR